MEYQFTLPGLQRRLESLDVAQSLAISNKQAERLFGFNDVSIARMERFATGHNCVIRYSDDLVVFLKV